MSADEEAVDEAVSPTSSVFRYKGKETDPSNDANSK